MTLFERVVRRWGHRRTRGRAAAAASTLDRYVRTAPSPGNAIAIFDGLWASRLPPPLDDVKAGYAQLFEDHRVAWAFERLGSVRGMRVLELGPLEGGHSYMLDRAGAAEVIAIEANTSAYLRCLVIKELVGMPAVRFLCGDFVEYLRRAREPFDLCFASGVLYHLQQPVELIARIADVADRVLIWTHYYDEAIVRRRFPSDRFGRPKETKYGGFRYRAIRYHYGVALTFASFCGGNQPWACWLTREDIIAALRHFGFRHVDIGPEQPDHDHGPALTLLATK